MSWEQWMVTLFEDLEQQAEGLALAERDAEIADLTQAEYLRVSLAARLHASVGTAVRVRLLGGLSLGGRISRLGEDWFLLVDGAAEWIVRSEAVVSAAGLSPRALAEESWSVVDRLSLRRDPASLRGGRDGVHRALPGPADDRGAGGPGRSGLRRAARGRGGRAHGAPAAAGLDRRAPGATVSAGHGQVTPETSVRAFARLQERVLVDELLGVGVRALDVALELGGLDAPLPPTADLGRLEVATADQRVDLRARRCSGSPPRRRAARTAAYVPCAELCHRTSLVCERLTRVACGEDPVTLTAPPRARARRTQGLAQPAPGLAQPAAPSGTRPRRRLGGPRAHG